MGFIYDFINSTKLWGIIGLILYWSTPLSFSKDLHARVGLGYNGQFASSQIQGGVPGISLKYGLTKDIGFSFIAGIKTGTPVNSVFASKFFKNIFYETNLNFYFTAGVGLVGANKKSGFELLSGFGTEFFIPGVESLGLSVETGVSIHNLEGKTVLRTVGVSFLEAGIHFYF